MAHSEVQEEEPIEEEDETSNDEYPSYAILLKMNDFINVKGAAYRDNVNHRIRGQCHSFDGDKVSNLGFLQV